MEKERPPRKAAVCPFRSPSQVVTDLWAQSMFFAARLNLGKRLYKIKKLVASQAWGVGRNICPACFHIQQSWQLGLGVLRPVAFAAQLPGASLGRGGGEAAAGSATEGWELLGTRQRLKLRRSAHSPQEDSDLNVLHEVCCLQSEPSTNE